MVYPDDAEDLDEVARAWQMPLSTLCWAVLHEWLADNRGVRVDFGEARGALWLAVEMALRDGEMTERLRRRLDGHD